MKPRIGVYLSKGTAARLAVAAKRREATKSALIEAALDRFLGYDETKGAVALAERLGELSGQIDQLDRNLEIMSEIVALHARFHLAVTPDLRAERPYNATNFGQPRFDEFTARPGMPLMQEAVAGDETTRPNVAADPGEGDSPGPAPFVREPSCDSASRTHEIQKHTAAAREDGSTSNFRAQGSNPFH